MKDDAVTESIAHFIGFWEIADEQARLRLDYARFKADEAKHEEQAQIDLQSARIKAPYTLKDFDPGLSYRVAPPPDPDRAPPPESVPLRPVESPVVLIGPPPERILPPVDENGGQSQIVYSLPAPSSLIGLTVQTAGLSDNDWVGPGEGYSAEQLHAFQQTLEALSDFAQSLSPIQLDLADIEGNWLEITTEIVEAAVAMAEAPPENVSVTLLIGEDAQGVFVNGEAVDELPEWQDFKPAYLRDEDEQDDEAAGGDDAGNAVVTQSSVSTNSGTAVNGEPISGLSNVPAGKEAGDAPVKHDFSRDFEGDSDNPFKVEDGHALVTGANQLVNEATIYSNWLDASVFAVGGDYVHFDGISQINILIEHDEVSFGPGALGAPLKSIFDADAGSTALNLAQIKTISSNARPEEKEDDAADPEDDPATAKDRALRDADDATSKPGKAKDGPDDAEIAKAASAVAGGAPHNWAVVRIDTDVVQVNWSQQFNFITDHDSVSYSLSGSNSFLGTGENMSINDIYNWELGFQYDLIFVAGNMIDVSLLKQINVLFDSDRIEIGGGVGKAASASAHQATGDDLPPADDIADPAPVSHAKTSAGTDAQAGGHRAETGTHGDTGTAAGGAHPASGGAATGKDAADGGTVKATAPAATAAESQDGGRSEHAVGDHGQQGASASSDGLAHGSDTAAVTKVSDDATSSAKTSAGAHQKASANADAAKTETSSSAAGQAATDAPAKAGAAGHQKAGVDKDGDAPEPAISTKDNLLVNQAEITTIGKDISTEMQKAFQKNLDAMKAGGNSVSDDVLGSGHFDGKPMLKVLYIDGDFKTLNVAQQTNVLGDSDSIHLAIEEFGRELTESIKMTAGSNLLANLASLKDTGIDSTIMAAGTKYSDSLIHQAELIEPEMPDLGAFSAGLANEAVAFLADDMIDPSLHDDIAASTASAISDAMSSSDIMQTMLS